MFLFLSCLKRQCYTSIIFQGGQYGPPERFPGWAAISNTSLNTLCRDSSGFRVDPTPHTHTQNFGCWCSVRLDKKSKDACSRLQNTEKLRWHQTIALAGALFLRASPQKESERDSRAPEARGFLGSAGSRNARRCLTIVAEHQNTKMIPNDR